ncbi:MAG TPA: 30S ribosomal protein S4 [Terriglobales bacterium]|nr:30S ribosomal protein S4 [Terriglobales bacterium]
MGDPKRTRKSYETPRHPWRRDQLEVELHLIGDFGLRNKRELWRYKTMLSEVRGIARSLLGSTEEERARLEKEYLSKLSRIGILSESASIDDL